MTRFGEIHEPADRTGIGDAVVSVMRSGGTEKYPGDKLDEILEDMAADVKIGMGTDAAVYPHGLNAHELAVYVSLGMTPLQAFQTATINDADLLGWSDKVGTLETGKWADIIGVDGDPLQDIWALQNVKLMVLGGRVMDIEFHSNYKNPIPNIRAR